MIGTIGAALALAGASLTPVSARRRLGPRVPPTRTTGQRLPARIAAGSAAGCLAAILAAALPVPAILAVTALGATLGLRHRRRLRRRRGVGEARSLQTALDVLVGELRVGAHPVRAFEVAAAETGHRAVAAGLRAVAARARLGADVAAGLRIVAGSSALPAQWERLAVYWQLSGEHGLAISPLMQAAQRDIAERQRFSARVSSGMAGARTSAAILAALPVLGVLLGQLIGAKPLSFLFGDRGGVPLLPGVILVCAGLLWSDRITERLV
ncbi:MAG TPA: type II secretion system F family protein [Mycobacterium sp.]|nr:type II secretion system F family protein [Mycobacterium sp.]